MKKFLFLMVAALLTAGGKTMADAVGDTFTAEVEVYNPRLGATTKTNMAFQIVTLPRIGKVTTPGTCITTGALIGLTERPCVNAASGTIVTVPATAGDYTVIGIGEYSFAGLNLRGLVLPDAISGIAQYAFKGFKGQIGTTSSTKAGVITLPAQLKTLGPNALTDYATDIETVIMPSTLTTIGSRALGNLSINYIEIPASVTSLASGFAAGCSQLTSLSVGKGIGNYYVAKDCNIIMDKNNEVVQGCIGSTIPATATAIKDEAFYGMPIESIDIPAAVTAIGKNAFRNSGLKYLRLPSTVTEIGNYAFCNCQNLERVDFMNRLITIGTGAFSSCSELSQVYIHGIGHQGDGLMPTLSGSDNEFANIKEGAKLYVHLGKLRDYRDDASWAAMFGTDNILATRTINAEYENVIDISDFTWPKAGETAPDYDITYATDGGVSNITVRYAKDGVPGELGTFEAGDHYDILFDVTLAEAYVFDFNHNVTIGDVSFDESADSPTEMMRTYTFHYVVPEDSGDDPKTIPSAQVEINDPIAGAEIPDNIVSPTDLELADLHYKVSAVVWTPGDAYFDDGKSFFVDNVAYGVYINLEATDGYVFADDFRASINYEDAIVTNRHLDSEGHCTSLTISYVWHNSATVHITGDVDDSGAINSADVVAIYSYIIEGDASGIDKAAANVDRDADGNVNSADVVAVYNYIINGNTPIVYTVNRTSFSMIDVEGGTFQMGATDDDSDASDFEKPQHRVTLSPFAIGATEVTQKLWTAVMGTTAHYTEVGNNFPAEHVTWSEACRFAQQLNRIFGAYLPEGMEFRLPTEAEWEYAARGGKKSQGYQFCGSDDIYEVAWTNYNATTMHEVAQLKPNELGLYDMTGNSWEFCLDWWGDYSAEAATDPVGPDHGDYRVARGCAFNNGTMQLLRPTMRDWVEPEGRFQAMGLRIVLGKKL